MRAHSFGFLAQRLKNHCKVGRPIINEHEIEPIFLNITNIYDFNRKRSPPMHFLCFWLMLVDGHVARAGQMLGELRKLRLDGIQALVNGLGQVGCGGMPLV